MHFTKLKEGSMEEESPSQEGRKEERPFPKRDKKDPNEKNDALSPDSFIFFCLPTSQAMYCYLR